MTTRRSRKWSGQAIDRLESRRTPSLAIEGLAGLSPLADVPIFAQPRLTTTPADGSTIEAADAPSALVFNLGGPAQLLWSDDGVELRRVAADGSEATVVGAGSWSPTTFNADGTVRLSLPAKLDPGRYRIVLVGGTGLAFTYAQGRWDPMSDRSIAEFQVKAPAASVDLGVVGPKALGATGVLDGSTDFDAFRIRLGDDAALWRLALQVDSGRVGSGLAAGLAVYDANGREVASAPAGSQFPSANPNDPYLFAGLPPGDYVVVVSKSDKSPGGAYRLEAAADPVVEPTRVASFALDRSDAGPAGFTIDFTSPIDPMRLRSDAIYVVDGSGSRHAVRLASVGEGLTRARFEFLHSLPAGEYRLVVAGDRPLADLIGRTPVAVGLPSGTLAAWSVSTAEEGPEVKPAPVAVIASGPIRLVPGSVLEIPIVVAPDQSLILEASLTSGAVQVELIGGPDGPVTLTDGAASRGMELWIRPGAGTFVLRIVSAGKTIVLGTWALRPSAMSDDSLVAAAIGNRGAIGLRMAEPSQPAPPTSPGPQETRSAPEARTSAAMPGRYEQGPSPWAYRARSSPIGKPTSTREAVGPIGPTAPGGRSAVASSVPSGFPGASLIPSAGCQADDGAPRGPAGLPEVVVATPAGDEQVVRATADADADDSALERAERVAGSVMRGLRWLLDRPEGADSPAGDVDALALARAEAADPGADGSEGKVQRSALDLPFTVLFVTASTFHLRRATRRWWNGRKLAADAASQARSIGPKPLFRGPRLMTSGRAASRPSAPRRG